MFCICLRCYYNFGKLNEVNYQSNFTLGKHNQIFFEGIVIKNYYCLGQQKGFPLFFLLLQTVMNTQKNNSHKNVVSYQKVFEKSIKTLKPFYLLGILFLFFHNVICVKCFRFSDSFKLFFIWLESIFVFPFLFKKFYFGGGKSKDYI